MTMQKPARWAVIENAGYEGECVRRGDFKSAMEAERYAQSKYDEDEREDLHVDIAFWDADGFWSYDY